MIDDRLDSILEGVENIKTTAEGKQDALVSGTNIKTINNNSILGEGNINIESGSTITVDDEMSTTSTNPVQNKVVKAALTQLESGTKDYIDACDAQVLLTADQTYQEKLVGTGVKQNVKTINDNNIVGTGNIQVQETLVSGTNIKTINNQSLLGSDNISLQEPLVSGTNIKTINGNSILGSGNIEIQTAGAVDSAMSDSSENAVQNKVIKTYVDSQISSVDSDINSIEAVIPTQAAANNQLADKDFVNSSIATSTAEFRGTYTGTTWEEALQNVTGDKNDYAFYQYVDSNGRTTFDRYKYRILSSVEVPEGYTQLNSINRRTNSNPYIITNCSIVPTDKISFEFTVYNSNYSYPYNFFGIYDGSSIDTATNGFDFKKTGSHSFEFRSKTSGTIQNSGTYNTSSPTQRLNVLIDENKLIINDISILSYSIPSLSSDLKLYICASNGNGNVRFDGYQVDFDVHRVTVTDQNGVKKLDLVPCKNSGNVNGMYDLVSESFIAPTNGTFGSSNMPTIPWEFEYKLNNSSFTSAQWAAINSGLAEHITNNGYNASATQILKHVNGVLTWVTES